MDVREKLTELLANAIIDSDDNYGFPNTTQVADHLIAHGVTVYEDTGLILAEVISMQGEWSAMMAALNSIGGGYTRLRELAEADKDGRLVVLPCRVGDTLFRVFAGEILEHKVGNMRYLAIQGRWDIDTIPFCPCVESSIGKTIFLTRKEAEKALEASEDG